jgi:hypothetical protein
MKIIFVTMILFGSNVFAKDNFLDLSKKLAGLRTEIESVNQDIIELRNLRTGRLKNISIQKAELESSINSENIKQKQLVGKIKELKSKISELDQGTTDFSRIFKSESAKMKNYIESTIPFKKEERLKVLTNLTAEVEKKELNSYVAVTRLWGMLEDEFRFTRENQLARDKITIGKSEYLAQVLKIGSIAQFYKRDDGQVGYAKFENDQWSMTSVSDADQVTAINNLYEGLRKQIRTGEYSLPSFVLKRTK